MVGFPKHLNSRVDCDYVIANFPSELWKPEIQKLLDNRHAWYPTVKLDAKDAGVTDDTHKTESIDGVRWQYELRINPAAIYKQFGYTVDKLNTLVAVKGTEYTKTDYDTILRVEPVIKLIEV